MTGTLMYEAMKAVVRHQLANHAQTLDKVIHELSTLSDAQLREVASTGVVPHKSDYDTH